VRNLSSGSRLLGAFASLVRPTVTTPTGVGCVPRGRTSAIELAAMAVYVARHAATAASTYGSVVSVDFFARYDEKHAGRYCKNGGGSNPMRVHPPDRLKRNSD
jgi:hypothetical protein